MVSSTLCPAVYILCPKMYTAGQRVWLTITGPGPSFLFFHFCLKMYDRDVLHKKMGLHCDGPEGPCPTLMSAYSDATLDK